MLHNKDPLKIQRAMARLVDYLLLFLSGGVIFLFLPFFIEKSLYYLLALAVPFLWVPIEAILLFFWGTTPGKALFGISLLDVLGTKLSWRQALKRAAFISPRPGVMRQVPLSRRRRIAGLAVGAACIFLAFFGNALTHWSMGWEKRITTDGWIQYYSEDAGFSVQFPNNPQEESKKLEIPSANKVLQYQEITSHQNRHVHYTVSYLRFPSKWKWAGSSTLLKGTLDAIVKHAEGTELLSRRFTQHQNQRAMDFRLKQGDNEVQGRLIIVGTKLYQLAIVYPVSLSENFAENPFFDTFDLTP